MKLVTFAYRDRERVGAIDKAGRIVDLQRAYGLYLREVEGESTRRATGADYPRPGHVCVFAAW